MSFVPLPSTTTEPVPRAGFSLPRDIVINPMRAFSKIAATHEWLPASVVIVVLSILTALLIAPAVLHVAAVTPPPAGDVVPHTQAALATARRSLVSELALREIMTPLLVVLLTASALTTVARFKAQATSYVTFVALAANCMIPAALGDLASGLAIRLHAPASYANLHALIIAFPTSLAIFANAANDAEVSFLSRFDLFSVWSSILLAFGFTTLTPVKFTTALALAFGLNFLFAVMF